MIRVIYAVGPNGEFGLGNSLPWNIPAEMKEFKRITADSIMLMTPRTLESLPSKLPGRIHVVLGDMQSVAKNGDVADVYLPEGTSAESAIGAIRGLYGRTSTICVIGGRKLIAEALPLADYVATTRIKEEFIDADESLYGPLVYFDDIDILMQLWDSGKDLHICTTEYGQIWGID